MRLSFLTGRLKGAVPKPQLGLFSILTVVLFLICLLSGFFMTFPDTVLRDRLVSEVNRRLPAGSRLEVETIALRFPLHLQASQVRLSMDRAALPELVLSTLSVSPTLSSLLGDSGAAISVESGLGHLDGTILQSGDVDLHLRDGHFELPLPGTQLSVSGEISVIDLVGQLQPEKEGPLRILAQVDKVLLSGTRQIGLIEDVLPVGSFSAVLDGSGRDLKIVKLELAGGAITLDGSGRIVLQQPLGASRLDLSLRLRPVPGGDPGVKTLLELLAPPGPEGTHVIQLRGRLQAPQLK